MINPNVPAASSNSARPGHGTPWRQCWLGILLIAGLLTSPGALAARHALLVGIGDYPQDTLDLAGPENDVDALQDVLVRYWDFSPEHIQVLQDRDATKAAILSALRDLLKRSEPGDQLFFYYSGHGTSAGDVSVGLPLPDMTAGLLPHDVKLNLSKHEIVSSLIVGRTDLRPVFQEIDRAGRQLLVMIDACYSGNAVRGFSLPGEKMKTRYVSLGSEVDTLFADADKIQTRSISVTASEQAYPYKNIFFIAASGEYEEAADISGPYLKKFPTIDGKAHGAFSDAMLRVMSGTTENVDANGDNRISHLETVRGIENWLAGKFPQTPQHLPPAEEDPLNLASRSIFGSDGQSLITGVEATPATSAPQTAPATTLQNTGQQDASALTGQAEVNDNRVKIALDPSSQYLAGTLSGLADVVVSDVYPDLRVVLSGPALELRNGANDLITSFPGGAEQALLDRITREVRVLEFLDQMASATRFGLSLDAAGKQNNGPHLSGEQVRFSIRTDRDAWILLVDIDRQGGWNILFPYFSHEQRIQPGNLVLQTPEIEVVPPFGTDRVVAFGFLEKPDALYQWLGEQPGRIAPESPRLDKLFSLIRQYSGSSASQSMPFITVTGR